MRARGVRVPSSSSGHAAAHGRTPDLRTHPRELPSLACLEKQLAIRSVRPSEVPGGAFGTDRMHGTPRKLGMSTLRRWTQKASSPVDAVRPKREILRAIWGPQAENYEWLVRFHSKGRSPRNTPVLQTPLGACNPPPPPPAGCEPPCSTDNGRTARSDWTARGWRLVNTPSESCASCGRAHDGR
jgi:hypothetical protein